MNMTLRKNPDDATGVDTSKASTLSLTPSAFLRLVLVGASLAMATRAGAQENEAPPVLSPEQNAALQSVLQGVPQNSEPETAPAFDLSTQPESPISALPASPVMGLGAGLAGGVPVEAAPVDETALQSTFVGATAASSIADALIDKSQNPQAKAAAVQVALERGRELAKLGLLQLAERQWREAVRLSPDSIEAHRALGYFLSGHEQWLEAAVQWREVLRLTHEARPQATKQLGQAKRRAWQQEAQREFDLARTHLVAPWQTPNIVSVGVDSANASSGQASAGASITVMSHAMLHPARLTLEAQQSARQERSLQTAGQFVRHMQMSVALAPAASRSRSTRTSRRSTLALRPVAQKNPVLTAAILTARRGVSRHAQRVRVASKSIEARHLARIALERAEQLATCGVPALAEAQLQQAVRYAPDWSETQRALALWNMTHEQWEEAAVAWHKVLSSPLPATQEREARRELARARQMISSLRLTQGWDALASMAPPMVSLGADSANARTITPGNSALSVEAAPLAADATLSVASTGSEQNGRLAVSGFAGGPQSTLAPVESAASHGQMQAGQSNGQEVRSAARVRPPLTLEKRSMPPLAAWSGRGSERVVIGHPLVVNRPNGGATALPLAKASARGGRWVLSLRVPAANEAARAESFAMAGAFAVDGPAASSAITANTSDKQAGE